MTILLLSGFDEELIEKRLESGFFSKIAIFQEDVIDPATGLSTRDRFEKLHAKYYDKVTYYEGPVEINVIQFMRMRQQHAFRFEEPDRPVNPFLLAC